uniref:Cullin-9 n=1 Tax=Malurus cyaneus samueli TaxID=2593467 RepID=A0A8C5TAV8_9PASS
MVNEKHNGSLLVQLGPRLQAYPEELLRQRRGHAGRPEYLVRWSVVSLEERAAGGGGASCTESEAESISMWMSADEVCASCPALLGHGRPEGPRPKEEEAPGAAAAPPDEASLLEMEADVRSLVRRARRQLAQAGTPEGSVLSTVQVLSAYAAIGSLAGAFRDTGALELLTAVLCHREKRIRRAAGEMLRALAAHDAGSRAHVLLSLSQQDGIEQHLDFDSRCTLLELFAEITSSAEHCMSFEGIHLPQVMLFVLVKRYLRVTSLLDKLSGGVELGEESPVPEERSRVKEEFEFSMAMASLISELVHAMGWSHGHTAEPLPRRELQPRGAHFASSSDYVEYLQAHLVPGMRVRLLEDCGDVRAGEEGEFLQSTNSILDLFCPQVLWQSTGRTCWMRWHILEIIGFGDQCEDRAAQEKELTRLSQPWSSRTSLRLPEAAEGLSRAEWWELLFFVRKLEAQEQKEITCLIQQHQGEQVDEEALMLLSVPAELAQEVLRALEQRCQGSSLRDLRGSRVYARYCLGGGSPAVSSEGDGPGGTVAEVMEDDLSAAPGPPRARSVAEKSDSELFSELCEREGLFFPELTEEQSKGNVSLHAGARARGWKRRCSCTGQALGRAWGSEVWGS